jgi:hypothetical protein
MNRFQCLEDPDASESDRQMKSTVQIILPVLIVLLTGCAGLNFSGSALCPFGWAMGRKWNSSEFLHCMGLTPRTAPGRFVWRRGLERLK